jgi:hypothetical protein
MTPIKAYARTTLALALVVFVQAAPARAFAEEEKPVAAADTKANEVKAKGDTAMEEGNFVEAHNLYKDAYTISPQPALLYNMGRAEERLGLYTDSLRNLEQFSRSASPELKTRVPKLADLLAEVRAHVALVTLHSNVAGARVLLRGKYVASTPVKWALATTGGKATLEVSADGYVPYQKEVVLEEGKNNALEVNLVAKGAATGLTLKGSDTAAPFAKGAPANHIRSEMPAKDEASHPITSKWWFWTGIGVGVMGGIALTAVLLSTEKTAPSGDLGQASAPLLRF